MSLTYICLRNTILRNDMDELENWEGEDEPFGEMAVQLGFCTAKDVREALNKQHRLRQEDGVEKLIGVIMMEEGLLTSEQVISILRMLEHRNGTQAPSEQNSA